MSARSKKWRSSQNMPCKNTVYLFILYISNKDTSEILCVFIIKESVWGGCWSESESFIRQTFIYLAKRICAHGSLERPLHRMCSAELTVKKSETKQAWDSAHKLNIRPFNFIETVIYMQCMQLMLVISTIKIKSIAMIDKPLTATPASLSSGTHKLSQVVYVWGESSSRMLRTLSP